jgi:hypothetical protein
MEPKYFLRVIRILILEVEQSSRNKNDAYGSGY